jgi:hypothetical protein
MYVVKTTGICAGILVSALLAACGSGNGGGEGGGDSGGVGNGTGNSAAGTGAAPDDHTSPPPSPGIHGIHVGSLSNGMTHVTFVLDDEEFYILYGIPTGDRLFTFGFFRGDGALNNGSLSSSDVRDYSLTGPMRSGSLSASFNPGISLNGSVTSGSTTLTFTGAPLASSPYNFHTAANPANLAGAWSITGMRGTAIVLNIGTNGSFTGSATGGCSVSGTMMPRASGKNVFDLALTYGPAPCEAPGAAITGAALEYMVADRIQQLVVVGTDSARTSGESFLGTRSVPGN